MIEETVGDDGYVLTQKNKFSVGDRIEVLKSNGENAVVTVSRILDERGEEQKAASHAKQRITVKLEGEAAEVLDILRKRCEEET